MMNFSKYKVDLGSKETVEPEEIFFDPKNITVDSLGQVEVSIKKRNVFVFSIIIFLLLSLLGGRSLYLQIFQRSHFTSIVESNESRKVRIESPRGIIFDRNGKQLVFNEPYFDLVVIPAFLPNSSSERSRIISKLSSILNISEDRVNSLIEEKGDYFSGEIVIEEMIGYQSALGLESRVDDMEGVYLIQKSFRKYVDSDYFSHIIGYVGKISPEELDRNEGYAITDTIGKLGLELYYEENLRGINGKKVFNIDSLRRKEGSVVVKDPIPGDDLLLTIDSELQKKLYDALSERLKILGLRKAAGVITDPSNGEVLALVSLPSFDGNIFTSVDSGANPQKIFNDPAQPLFNRVISGTYPPGSTIKPILGSAILEENLISPHKKIFAASSISLVNQYNPDIVYTYSDWKEHGWIDITDAIAYSSNVYFYTLGGGYGNIDGLGVNKINEYLKQFKLGETLGIDLVGEAKGLIPNPEWKKIIRDEEWHIGDTYNLSIGQGDISVTPLQLTSAIGLIANSNDGWYKPHIVREIIGKDESFNIKPIEIGLNFIEQSNLDIIKEGMRKAVTEGSAKLLYSAPVPVAGKTGTAQFGNEGKTHAWFTGFAPFNDPEIVITVLIEGGGEGSASAVPVAKEVIEWYFRNYQ